jgi:outer membrane protein OmpA-like peptidoglycan-associated protein
MRISIRGRVLLVSACILARTIAWAQQPQSSAGQPAFFTDLAVTYSPEHAELVPGICCFWMKGGGADAAVTFWKGFGIAASLTGEHASNYTHNLDVNKVAYLAGPRYTYTAWASDAGVAATPRFQIFGEGLFGGTHAFNGAFPSGSSLNSNAGSYEIQTGGGLDVFFFKHYGVRLLEADYVRTALPNGASNIQNDLRLAFGVTYHIGSAPPPPVTLQVFVNPDSIFPGDPVTLTATASNLDPKLNAIYSWSGASVMGSGTTATVDTTRLAPGTYTVKAQMKEGKPGKEGLKPWESADASSSFTVKAYEPPTINCSVSPSSIKPGESATISFRGISPQNRPLNYSYSTASKTVSISGTTASFSSTGMPTGTTSITCNVSDDKGQTATDSTTVTITAPYVAPVPHTLALCSISFDRDTKRPTRVDNEAKACLDEVALALQKQSDAKAVVVGDSNAAEKTPKKVARHARAAKVEDLAAERAVNTKDYLVTEKGIDASRISVATDATDGQKVKNYLVPSGVTFSNDVTGTTPVDETVVKPQVRKPLPAKPAHKKTGAK